MTDGLPISIHLMYPHISTIIVQACSQMIQITDPNTDNEYITVRDNSSLCEYDDGGHIEPSLKTNNSLHDFMFCIFTL